MVNNLSGYVNFSGKASVTKPTEQKSMGSNTQSQSVEQTKSNYSAENIKAYNTVGINTGLSSDEVKQKYSELSAVLEPEARVALSGLLKSGILLNNNSNDGSTVLDNLHKIVTEPRIRGLNAKTLATEAIEEISNPGKITQTFGDIPDSISEELSEHPEFGISSKEEMDIGTHSSCCVAASIEYNIASRTPAEFARMAAGLSSEDYSVTKDLKLTDITEKKDDAMWLLEKFKIPYSIDDKDNIKVTIAPDRNAIIRARVQTSYRDEGERSSLDVLIQSALMNVGSQQTYNSLNDKRVGLFNEETNGLLPIEKTFVAEIATGSSKVPVIYQALGEDRTVLEVACDYDTMAQQLITALQTDNVIAGYVDLNLAGQAISGHEITIIDACESPTGDLVFVCNDTADSDDEPIYILAQNLLPRLNHADLPKRAIGDTPMPSLFDGIPYYKEVLG